LCTGAADFTATGAPISSWACGSFLGRRHDAGLRGRDPEGRQQPLRLPGGQPCLLPTVAERLVDDGPRGGHVGVVTSTTLPERVVAPAAVAGDATEGAGGALGEGERRDARLGELGGVPLLGHEDPDDGDLLGLVTTVVDLRLRGGHLASDVLARVTMGGMKMTSRLWTLGSSARIRIALP
jgi:hypothetical protein